MTTPASTPPPFDEIDVASLLPQCPPFVFADRLLHCDELTARTTFTVTGDCVFVSDGVMEAAGLVEVIAQASAARIGYVAKYIRHEPIANGYIGAVKRLDITGLPLVGDTLTTEIRVVAEAIGLTRLTATVASRHDITLATAEMTVAL